MEKINIKKNKKIKKKYDVIVIGSGHAGCEASLAAAQMGCQVMLITIDFDKTGLLPCSPSIGGMAKGQLVKEIDALGGAMAKIADKSAIQYKTLNTKKGPAVQSTRTQNDRHIYQTLMKKMTEQQNNLEIKQEIVKKIIIDNNIAIGIKTNFGVEYNSKTIILATGTFLRGIVHVGSKSIKAGRMGELASYNLAKNMAKIGFKLGRMKTGTPPRLDKSTIDFSKFKEMSFDTKPKPFSFSTPKINIPQISSFMGYSNPSVHKIIKKNLHLSSLYGGMIKGTPARYCPSFEDKIFKFPNKLKHQLILEPEGLGTREIYVSGLGNSLPIEIQIKAIRNIRGFEEAKIIRPGYAIEYDYINPIHLKPTLESKIVNNLYMAGQINGTSGYEEAAAQGIYAGINAACSILEKPPFILDRSQAYIGVMIDDLVTRGTKEPYRMFTSRSEYRLTLREDNAIFRLTEDSYKLGLTSLSRLKYIRNKKRKIKAEIGRIKTTTIKPSYFVNNYLFKRNSTKINKGIKLGQLLKRTELNYELVRNISPSKEFLDLEVITQVELEIKYEGYIKKQLSEIGKFKNIEQIKISQNINYETINGLSNELKEKLIDIRPTSLGQASRIDGMTPAAISVLMVYLKD